MNRQRYYTNPISRLSLEDYLPLIRMGLTEDCPESDITSESIFSESEKGQAVLVTREKGVFCGAGAFDCFHEIFRDSFLFELKVQDGERIEPGAVIAKVSGNLLALLRIERVLLNMIQYLSGIASATRAIVDRYPSLLILDTRKTLPGYRLLVKYAVYMGGGANHRIHLSDMGLIKDNHVALAGSIQSAVQKIRSRYPERKIELEIDTLSQLDEAILSRPDIILLDNFSIDETKKAVHALKEKAPSIQVECSGGITPEKLKALSEIGDIGVSMGYLTHTTRFMDLSLEIEKNN
jgi:nicotinate-nucleotide pyrophosphorylase (carboxylating)